MKRRKNPFEMVNTAADVLANAMGMALLAVALSGFADVRAKPSAVAANHEPNLTHRPIGNGAVRGHQKAEASFSGKSFVAKH